MAQANALSVTVDLDTARFARFGIVLDVRERGADDEQRLAGFHDFLRWKRPQNSDAACCVWVVIRQHSLAKKSLRNGCAKKLSRMLELGSRIYRATASQYRDLG